MTRPTTNPAIRTTGPTLRLVGTAALLLAAVSAVGCGTKQKFTMDREALSRVKVAAILPFTGGTTDAGVKPGEAFSAVLVQLLRESAPQLELAERTRLQDLVDEKKGLAGGSLQRVADAGDLGKFLQVDAIITGSVQEYGRNATTKDNGYLGGHTVSAGLRIIDVRTGRVIYSSSAYAARLDGFADAVRQTCTQLVAPLRGSFASH